MPPKILPLAELNERIHNLSDLILRIARDSGLAHLVDVAKFPEFSAVLGEADPTAEPVQPAEENGHTEPAAAPVTVRPPAVPTVGHRRAPQAGVRPPAAPQPAPGNPAAVSSGNWLEFKFTGDQGGLVSFIATNQGTEPWTNPVDSGLIKVEASSIKKGRPAEVVDSVFTSQVFYTDNIPYSWITIDFGNYRIKPSHYTFAHRAGNPNLGFFLRSWELHASNDGETWVIVRKHQRDESLNPNAMIATWQIEDHGLGFYHLFRFVIDPEGNSSRSSALVVSCFEIYGEWCFESSV